ncbi:hypothetical protein [Microbulbifer halophilus]|uniref:Uncharacterized protein n=1 Tax=Microbulbifer halophilus TaxID=453963 RepID=A0ABW5EFB5_9GAMM|nr:hypothetical protein [Microbulbifer halophilus]MCW8126580.1 hypothetical protein [Microbulbifer halophilus]
MKEFEIGLEETSKFEVDEYLSKQESGKVENFLRIATPKLIDKVLENSKEATLRKISSEVKVDVLKRALGVASEKSLRWYVQASSLSSLKRISAASPNSLIEKLIDVAADQKRRETILKSLPIQRRQQWEDYIRRERKRSKELRESATQAEESLVEERKRIADDLSSAIKSKEEALAEAEQVANLKQKHLDDEIANAKERLNSLLSETSEREEELKKQEESLAQRIKQLNEEHQKQVQQRIEIKVPEYVSAAVKVLENLENKYREKARNWSIHGTVVLIAAVIVTVAISILGTGIIDKKAEEIGWPLLIFMSFKGLVVLSVLGLWARHAFTVSNAYMHEAIKRSDRAHAINFGKLYFEIYGNAVDRSELVEIFENWNIASESAFSKIKIKEQDIQVVEQIKELVKVIKQAEGKET